MEQPQKENFELKPSALPESLEAELRNYLSGPPHPDKYVDILRFLALDMVGDDQAAVIKAIKEIKEHHATKR